MKRFSKKQQYSAVVVAVVLTIGVMLYEYTRPPIQFKTDANGNISIPASTKPEDLFVNPSAGDFRLKPENPAVRGGVPLTEVSTDSKGHPRDPQHPSIGAIEFTGTPNTTGGGASKFFSAPFTYFVLLTTLLANILSLHISAKILRESSRNQMRLIGLFKQAVLKRTSKDRRKNSKLLEEAPAESGILEDILDKTETDK